MEKDKEREKKEKSTAAQLSLICVGVLYTVRIK